MADEREFYRELKWMTADEKAGVLKSESGPGLDAWRGVEVINDLDGRRTTVRQDVPISDEALAGFLRGTISVGQLEEKAKALNREKNNEGKSEKTGFLFRLVPLQIRRLI